MKVNIVSQHIIKNYKNSGEIDKEMLDIIAEEESNVIQMYKDAVEQEKAWANLFKDGSMIGLNDKLLHNYVEFIANKRMRAMDLTHYMIN